MTYNYKLYYHPLMIVCVPLYYIILVNYIDIVPHKLTAGLRTSQATYVGIHTYGA